MSSFAPPTIAHHGTSYNPFRPFPSPLMKLRSCSLCSMQHTLLFCNFAFTHRHIYVQHTTQCDCDLRWVMMNIVALNRGMCSYVHMPIFHISLICFKFSLTNCENMCDISVDKRCKMKVKLSACVLAWQCCNAMHLMLM